MMVRMVLLLLVMKMPEPRKDLVLEELLPWLVHLVNMLNMQVMKVEVVQVETVQQVIIYWQNHFHTVPNYCLMFTGAGGAYEYDYEGYAGAAAGQGTGA